MPFYRFILHGRTTMPSGPGGFFTTRWCWAVDESAASQKVLNSVRANWNGGPISKLEVDEGWRIGFREIWSAPNKGCTFYSDED